MTTLNLRQYRPTRSMGSPTTVLRHFERGMAAGEVKVPCNGCNACCRVAGLMVDLTADEAQRLPKHHWDAECEFVALDKNPDGSCVYLVDGRCSIYAERPKTCRTYDCRFEALLGFTAISVPGMNEVTGQWYPELKTVDDRDLWTAMRLAVVPVGLKGGDIADAKKAAEKWRDYLPKARELRQAFDRLPPAVRDQMIAEAETAAWQHE